MDIHHTPNHRLSLLDAARCLDFVDLKNRYTQPHDESAVHLHLSELTVVVKIWQHLPGISHLYYRERRGFPVETLIALK